MLSCLGRNWDISNDQVILEIISSNVIVKRISISFNCFSEYINTLKSELVDTNA